MKVKNNKLFPYPVLNKYNDSYKNNNFDTDVTLTIDGSNVIFTLSNTIPDEIMLNLIKDGVVGVYFHVDCSTTHFRKVYKLDNPESAQIFIDIKDICDEVETILLLIADKDIVCYKNNNLDDFYLDVPIDITQHSILGFTDTDSFIINKRTDNKGEIPSLFSVTADEEGKKMSYDYDGYLIQIFLPIKEYNIYSEFKGKRKRLKQQMINVPVLVEILDIIKNDESEIISTKPWYDALEGAMINKGFHNGFSDEKFKNTPSIEVAQELLGTIIQDAFAEFDEVQDD